MENSFQAHKRQIPGVQSGSTAACLNTRPKVLKFSAREAARRTFTGCQWHQKQNPSPDEVWCAWMRWCAASLRLRFNWRYVRILGQQRRSKHGISLLGSDAVGLRQEAIWMPWAAQPPLHLFLLSRLISGGKKLGRGALESTAQEEAEALTGYFGLACSEALMQTLQICFLTKSPVAVMKRDWAPASVFALRSHIFAPPSSIKSLTPNYTNWTSLLKSQ